MELWRRAAVVATKGSGGLVVRYGPGDVEVWRYGALEARCRRADVEVGSVGGVLQACRMEASRYGALNFWRRDAGVGTGRHGGLERAAGRSDRDVCTWETPRRGRCTAILASEEAENNYTRYWRGSFSPGLRDAHLHCNFSTRGSRECGSVLQNHAESRCSRSGGMETLEVSGARLSAALRTWGRGGVEVSHPRPMPGVIRGISTNSSGLTPGWAR